MPSGGAQEQVPGDSPQNHPALGFSDCLILEVARKVGHLPLGTFDRELAKLAGTHKL